MLHDEVVTASGSVATPVSWLPRPAAARRTRSIVHRISKATRARPGIVERLWGDESQRRDGWREIERERDTDRDRERERERDRDRDRDRDRHRDRDRDRQRDRETERERETRLDPDLLCCPPQRGNEAFSSDTCAGTD